MLGAIELVKDKATRERHQGRGAGMICRQFCFDNGLIMRAVGDTMIIAPPLVISREEVDELVSKARLCLDLTLNVLNG
jgi:putrescine aminotransferase